MPEKPKQFIDVMGVGKTMIQLTVERFKGIISPDHVWIVTSKKYKDLVKEQLPEVPDTQILMEPCMRNTAPCIEYVSRKIYAKHPDANLIFSPADHLVLNVPHFQEVINDSLDYTKGKDVIVTLGMMPTRPETGYGYIKAADANSKEKIHKVEAFKEKPNLETAKKYLAEGGYYWNAGIFIWNAKMVVNTIEKLVPELAEVFDKIEPYFYKNNEQDIIDELFPTCPNISIDYAVMEKSNDVFVFPADFGWSDIGTWGSLFTHAKKDDAGNALRGQIVSVDNHNTIINIEEGTEAVIQGLDDYLVAYRDHALLVCRLRDEQQIKVWIEGLK